MESEINLKAKPLKAAFLFLLTGLYLSEALGILIFLIASGFSIAKISKVLSSATIYGVALITICFFRTTSVAYYWNWLKKKNLLKLKFRFSWKLLPVLIVTLIFILLWKPDILAGKPQSLTEFTFFKNKYGIYSGSLLFLLQYIYYFLEALVIVLILEGFQTAGEAKFSRSLPWGGIALIIFWSGIHFFSKGISTGIYAVCQGIIFSAAFLWDKRNGLIVMLIWFLSLLL